MEPTKYAGFANVFPGKLGFWCRHCLINALPSYLIAVVWLGLWHHPVAHIAMGCAVLTFIIGYAVATSLPGPLADKDNLFSRALRSALMARLVISVVTIAIVPTGIFLIFTPDLWCGRLAVFLVSETYGFLGFEGALLNRSFDSGLDGLLPGFMEIYLTTVLEGLILSFLLFIISFIAVIILQARDRKRMYSSWRN